MQRFLECSRFDDVLDPLLFLRWEVEEHSKFFFYLSKVLKSLINRADGCIQKHIEKCSLHFLQFIFNNLILRLKCLLVVLSCFCFSSASVLISLHIAFTVVCASEKPMFLWDMRASLAFFGKSTATCHCMQTD